MRIGLRELIFFAVLAALPLVAYFWPWSTPVKGIKQWNEDIAQARDELQQKRQKLDRLQTTRARIESLGQEIDKLSKAIKVFEKKLPKQRQVEVVLKEVWQLAKKHDLTPESVRTAEIEPAAHYAELPINMDIAGDFDGFYSFLIDVEQMPRVTQMPTMRMEKLEEDDASGQMKASVVLSIFFESASEKSNSDQASRI